jgi:hypothetical protein
MYEASRKPSGSLKDVKRFTDTGPRDVVPSPAVLKRGVTS